MDKGEIALISDKPDPKPVKKIVMGRLCKNRIVNCAIIYHILSLLILNQHVKINIPFP